MNLKAIREAIINDPFNLEYKEKWYLPVYQATEKSKILIVGQVPALKFKRVQWLGMIKVVINHLEQVLLKKGTP